MTSKGPTTNLAAQPAIAPAVASVTGLLFVCFAADIGVLAESTHLRPITRHCVAALIAADSDEGQRERNAWGMTDAQTAFIWHSLSEPMCVW